MTGVLVSKEAGLFLVEPEAGAIPKHLQQPPWHHFATPWRAAVWSLPRKQPKLVAGGDPSVHREMFQSQANRSVARGDMND